MKYSVPQAKISGNYITIDAFGYLNPFKKILVGTLRARIFVSERYIQIDAFSVHPEHRRKKIGTTMWEVLKTALCDKSNIEYILVYPHPYYDLPLFPEEKEPDSIELSELYDYYLQLSFDSVNKPLDKSKCDQPLIFKLR